MNWIHWIKLNLWNWLHYLNLCILHKCSPNLTQFKTSQREGPYKRLQTAALLQAKLYLLRQAAVPQLIYCGAEVDEMSSLPSSTVDRLLRRHNRWAVVDERLVISLFNSGSATSGKVTCWLLEIVFDVDCLTPIQYLLGLWC